jgi:hypothetical protein
MSSDRCINLLPNSRCKNPDKFSWEASWYRLRDEFNEQKEKLRKSEYKVATAEAHWEGKNRDELVLKNKNARLESKVKQLEAQVEELKKFKEQTEEQSLAKLFKKLMN